MNPYTGKLRNLIANDDLETAIEHLLECLKGKHARLYNEAILHSGALAQNNKSISSGILSNADANLTRNRIRLAILSILSDIEKEQIQCGNEVVSIKEVETTSTIVILFVGANPTDTTRIQIDKELKDIEINIRLSKERANIVLKQRWAVTPLDLQQALLDENPTIVHFSGHGLTQGILLEDENGNAKLISRDALKSLFELFSDTVKCVVLNACYSESQAKAIAEHIPFVVGMNNTISDKAAITFSSGFYKALGAGKDIAFAFKLGVNAIQLQGLVGDIIPQLIRKENP